MRAHFAAVAILAVLIPLSGQAQADDWSTCRASGDALAAIDGCSAIIEREVGNPSVLAEAYYLRGRARYERDELDTAISDLAAAIERDPDNPEAHHQRGMAYKKRGDYELAIRDFQNALNLRDPLGSDGAKSADKAETEAVDDKPEAADTKSSESSAAAKKRRAQRKRVQQRREKAKRAQVRRKQQQARKRQQQRKKQQAKKKKEDVRTTVNKQLGCAVAGGFDC